MVTHTGAPREPGAPSNEGAAPPRTVRLAVLGWVLLGVTIALSVTSMAVPALIDHPLTRDRGEVQLFLDVGEEGNLPTWWSTALLVVAAVVYIVVGALARARRTRGAWAWFVGAAMLGLLSLDEHTELHGRLDRIGQRIVSFAEFPFYWLLPGLAVAAVVAVAVLLLAVRLSGAARWCVIGGCVLLLGSALGGELLQGLQLAAERGGGPLYVLTFHAEEFGETAGVLLMIAAAVRSVTLARLDGHLLIGYAGRDVT